MNVENKLAKLMRNTGPARFLVPLGIILVIFGVIMFGMRTDTFEETLGTVTAVEDGDYDEDGGQQYDVSVSYTVNGKQYEGTFMNLSGNYKTGDAIKVYYNPDNPESISNTKMAGFIPIIIIVVGVAAAVFGLLKTVKAVKKSRELDKTTPGRGAAPVDFDGFKNAEGVTEYYSLFDGSHLKPGYVIEDGAKNVLFEAKMLKNNPVGPRTYEFINHTNIHREEHEVGHVTTTNYNNSVFSVSSWFKFDGKNIWDLLHERGLRMTTDMRTKFPYLAYNVSRDGKPFARIEMSSIYVHEEDEAQHKIVVPPGQYYYRFWTDSDDMELLFLTIFAISETEQTMVE